MSSVVKCRCGEAHASAGFQIAAFLTGGRAGSGVVYRRSEIG